MHAEEGKKCEKSHGVGTDARKVESRPRRDKKKRARAGEKESEQEAKESERTRTKSGRKREIKALKISYPADKITFFKLKSCPAD